MRAFIAVRIPATPSLQNVLRELDSMRSAVRPVGADQLHVTLKFLGGTSESQIEVLQTTLREVSQSEPCFDLVMEGLGAFPRIERPSVVWIGFANSEPLVRLASLLEDRCRQLGFEAERCPFQPHLTIARIKSEPPRRAVKFLHDNANGGFGTARIAEIELLRSDLKPDGPVYSVIGRAALFAQ